MRQKLNLNGVNTYINQLAKIEGKWKLQKKCQDSLDTSATRWKKITPPEFKILCNH